MEALPGHRFLAVAALALALGPACNALTGIDDLEVGSETTGSGTPTSSGGAGGAHGATGSSGTNGSTSSAPSGSTSASSGSAETSSGATSSTSSGQGSTTSGGSTSTSTSASSSTSASTSSSGSTTDPEPPDMVGMTAAHNAARAAVVPSATPPLPQMAWSSTVAASAQAWANNCVFADTGPPYGSNAFAGTGTYTPAEVVASWVSEDADYDYATNTCAQGKECGHYTQVVWRDSVGLGCGMATCTKNSPFGGSGAWQLWICNYDPPGNYVGEKPY